MKKYLICLIVLFSAFLGFSKVSAAEISQFCEYTDPCLTTEDIDNFILEKNIDTSVYDRYVLTISKVDSSLHLHLSFFKSEDIESNKVYVSSLDDGSYWLDMNDISFYSYQKIISIGSKFDETALKGYQFYYYDSGYRVYEFSNDLSSLVYYSNVDILDGNGNVVLEKNSYSLSDYTDPIFTKKDLDTIIKNNNIDTNIYDNYFIVFKEWYSSSNTYYDMTLYLFKNDDLDNIYIQYDSSDKAYEFFSNPSTSLYYNNISSSNKKIDISLYNVDMNFYNNWTYSSFTSSLTKNYIYYSNVDIKDNNGNITFPKRELPATDEEENEFYEYPKQGGNTDKIYSIDYTFTPETYNFNTKIKYEIDYNDNWDKYSDENVEKYLYVDNFYFYGLVNNNGLYHYEKLGTTSGSYIDDYVEKYENGKYYLDINSFNLDFSNYEKIIVRAQFLADGNLTSVTSFSNNNKITNNDVFYNTVFGEKYLNMNIDTSNSLYLDLSTDLDIYDFRFYIWGCDFSNPYKYPYLLYFSTETSLFLNESVVLELEYSPFLGYDMMANSYSDFQIGKSNKKAVALTRDLSNNSDINFNYNLVFNYNNLYFSYNNEKTHSNKIYMDHNGNWFQDDNVNAENSNIPSSSNILNIFKDFIQHLNKKIFTYFNQIWILLKNYRIFTYFWILIVGSIICLIIKSASRK